jgi:hypothetical protein
VWCGVEVDDEEGNHAFDSCESSMMMMNVPISRMAIITMKCHDRNFGSEG